MIWTEKAREAILASSEHSPIYIGADSVRFKKGYHKDGTDRWFARYATVIVLHMDGCHGCKIFHNKVVLPDYGQLRTRLLTEVQMSLEAFNSIEDIIGSRPLEIHLDVNPNPKYKSNIVAKEALGWVTGMGVTARIKSDAWAASTAADYLARGHLC